MPNFQKRSSQLSFSCRLESSFFICPRQPRIMAYMACEPFLRDFRARDCVHIMQHSSSTAFPRLSSTQKSILPAARAVFLLARGPGTELCMSPGPLGHGACRVSLGISGISCHAFVAGLVGSGREEKALGIRRPVGTATALLCDHCHSPASSLSAPNATRSREPGDAAIVYPFM